MKIFTAAQVRAWDAATIDEQGISSLDLMERAAACCTEWLLHHCPPDAPFALFCGRGNNGGDGLAIVRQLLAAGRSVSVYVVQPGRAASPDFAANHTRLAASGISIGAVEEGAPLPGIPAGSVVVDALFGAGLNKPLEGVAAALTVALNDSGASIISIDLPSGLFMDRPSTTHAVIRATHTLTFGAPKLALLLQENAPFIGAVQVLGIGLSTRFAQETQSPYFYLTNKEAKARFRPRPRFAHKGSFGHLLLAAGARGKMGAALLAATAAARGGAGLLSCHIPRCGELVLQTALPEAMLATDACEDFLTELPADMDRYDVVAIGPGIGTSDPVAELLERYLQHSPGPMVLDADALNILAQHPYWLLRLPPGSILTPHPKEFDRLFGTHTSDFDRIRTALDQAAALKSAVLLKGHHTFVALPDGTGAFNSTGNPGMARGGSGDVLTGLLGALLAQGYSAADAALLGVYLHGAAGDSAAAAASAEAMLPSDLILHLGNAFRRLY
ncbi:NAD(P)H-hydrate dehydratase [Flaviaesturariibacter amylovorans]|uniref:Bifunctional NAD(P)H-hydrate repair enzyme n=1 Tax=Flaviaesturariibacter amylovorans TaxID=1084520 RepID=A0ABP8GX96_9BACT